MMVRLDTTLLVGAMMIAMAFISGCGNQRPTPIKVTGTVTYRGQPVQHANVNFIPKNVRAASGKTDAQGRFELMTYEPGDGAIAGEHSVVIAKFSPKPAADTASPYPETISVLPPRYASPLTSELTAQVTSDGPNDFTFELKP
ncbi:MAG: hypothetical protein U9N87_08190 [Planctomycetota bacterium]|nr:hypothetical protein [Planctomycetota bacterium]